jgi:hypothetical protein
MQSREPRDIKAIPTLYKGVQYRSRLEAKWAAFFDLLGWRFQYEPFDLEGWIPDFLILGHESVLVEVKPGPGSFKDAVEKIENANPQLETLLVGATIGERLGQIRIWNHDESCPNGDYWCWWPAVFVKNVIDIRIGFTHIDETEQEKDRITGIGWRRLLVCESDWQLAGIVDLWNQAGNLVQWRGVQNRGV